MFCIKCGSANRDEAVFCKQCGVRLHTENHPNLGSKSHKIISRFNLNFLKLKLQRLYKQSLSVVKNVRYLKLKAKNKKMVFAVAIVVILVLSPFIKAYADYSGGVKAAQQLLSKGDFEGALSKLKSIKTHSLSGGAKKTLNDKISFFEKMKADNDSFEQAKQKEESGNLTEARGLLISISSEQAFPKISEVNTELQKVNDGINAKIQSEADSKVAAAQTQAEEQAALAKTEQANRQKAEAEAQEQQAAAQAAQNQAQQQAAAAAQAAQQRAEEVKRSFRNQLVSAYNAVSGDAYSYYASGIGYSNSGQSLLAINAMSDSKAVLNSARSNVPGLNEFVGLPSNYYTAASYMVSAIDNLGAACDLVVETEDTSNDQSATINSDKNSALYYLGLVKSFLDANSD